MAVFEREVMWMPFDGPGLEMLRLQRDGLSFVATAMMIGIDGAGHPFRCLYTMTCDRFWRARKLSIDLPDRTPAVLRLRGDGDGRWETGLGEPLPQLDGCLDIMIAVTPFTNTLPIRRLSLAAGQAGAVRSVRVAVPELTLTAIDEHYACERALGTAAAGGGMFVHTDIQTGTTMRLEVDADGLVYDYPDRFKRVYTEPIGRSAVVDVIPDGPDGYEPTLGEPEG